MINADDHAAGDTQDLSTGGAHQPRGNSAFSKASWLDANHTAIIVICTVVQTLVVTFGVGLVIHQLNMMGRSEQRMSVRATYQLWTDAESDLDSLFAFADRFGDTPTDTADYSLIHVPSQRTFGELEICIGSGECDLELGRRLFCPAAVRAAAVVVLSEELLATQGPEELALHHFAIRCFPECAQEAAYVHWVPMYREFFPDAPAVRSGRIDDESEVRSDFVCTFSP